MRSESKKGGVMARKNVSNLVSAMGVLMSIITALVVAVKKNGGTDEDIYRLATPEGESIIEKIAQIISTAGKKAVAKIQTEYLKLLFVGEIIFINATDGKKTLARAKNIFQYIDSDLKSLGTDKAGDAKEKTEVCIYELTKNTNFGKFFGSLDSNIKNLCFTQSQIIEFVKKHKRWLRGGRYATFFPFETNNEVFVAGVRVFSGGELEVSVRRFGDLDGWCAGDGDRVVVPRLA